MAYKGPIQVFEEYQKARIEFTQAVACLATRAVHIECLSTCGAIELLNALVVDQHARVQQCAVLALGRMAEYPAAAQKILEENVIRNVLKIFDRNTKQYRKGSLFLFKNVAKHSATAAEALVHDNALEAIVSSLEEFEPGIKEAAAWAVAQIAKHSPELAESCRAAGSIPVLRLCFQEPELCLKQVSATALSEISKHNLELANAVVDSGIVPYYVKSLTIHDSKLKAQLLCALSVIAKHNLDLAEAVVESDTFPDVLIHMGHTDHNVKRNAAMLTKNVVKHSVSLANLVVNSGGVGALLECVDNTTGNNRLPAIMALGFICASSETLAMAVISSQGICTLSNALQNEKMDHVLSALIWALTQVGKHSTEHSRALADSQVYQLFLRLYNCPDSSDDLRQKCFLAWEQCLSKCTSQSTLDDLIKDAPPELFKFMLYPYTKILPHDANARRNFVTAGHLRKLQEIEAKPGSSLMEYINAINKCFPEEIVRYYTPGYSEALLRQVEQYTPPIPILLDFNVTDDSEEFSLKTQMDTPAHSWDECM